ncbi:MAG TPA: tRNA uracil 4-sulfurtransferase ThiI [Vicinamibacterales bacterium]|nr:tRNA uracil 4-sulfurtransferase ThiI [Vicinamibacterales bacterium]
MIGAVQVMTSIVVHYQEIALKGRNRPWFIGRLVRHIRRVTRDLDVVAVRPLMGRIEVVLGPRQSWDEVRERLSYVFGIANFSKAGRTRADFDQLAAAVLADLRGHETTSFRVTARRADKRFPLTSPEIERRLGALVQREFGWRVDLAHPELVVQVEILPDEAFYCFGKERGAGGLPGGVSGRVVCLLSGGIDSPVATWRMMRRGCHVVPVHFHSVPFLGRASQEKVREIATLLSRYQLHVRLFQVAFGEIQRQIVLSTPPAPRVVLYRRMMLRIAEALARRAHAQALVTGEVVGQVASQTLENLAVIDAAATMPVLRPLVGLDKDEITAEAQRIGTYPISIIPDQDCCQLFTPRHPATKARLADVEQLEADLPVAEMVERAAADAVVEEFRFPVVESRV